MSPMTLRRQRGATLVVALVMLVLLTLFALTAMNASNTSLKIANNTQTRAEVAAAVQQEIDKAMSIDFTLNPAIVAGNKAVDINNDGTTDYNVVITTPTCIGSLGIPTAVLDPTKPSDAACYASGASTASGVIVGGVAGGGSTGSSSGNSLCSNSLWELGASATDPISGARVSIRQGIAVRVAIGTPC